MKKRFGFLLVFCILSALTRLLAQAHISVSLDDPVYAVIDQAEIRGLCAPLPKVKPYSRTVVLAALESILSSAGERRLGTLSDSERVILELMRDRFRERTNRGLDLQRGSYYIEESLGKNATHISAEAGLRLDLSSAGGFYTRNGDFVWGTGNWISGYVNGDIGRHLSYGFNISGGVINAPRDELGKYNTYHDGFVYDKEDPARKNEEITIYSQPLTYFPYTYEKRWDAFVFGLDNISNTGGLTWPEKVSIGYTTLPEVTASLLDDRVTLRIGRLAREWGAMNSGDSLVFNQAARPFVAIEATVSPFSWLNFSSLTGVLEYYDLEGVKVSSSSSQNAFSISMLELNYRNFFHIDFGSASVWAKRFELGYIFPLLDNFLYQNSIGDNDNTSLFLNINGQYPGLGRLWFSVFLDEINPESEIFKLDRAMYAFQVGTRVSIPRLSFASLSLSYTKIEPYTYTHTKEILPWYGDTPMESSYTNNGVSLGHYLPPNSDEIKLRFDMIPLSRVRFHGQYQMLRHGADHGSKAVDGSNLLSELDPSGRSTKDGLKKFFLQDGAYQWMHIIKVGAEYSFMTKKNTSLFQIFGEAGVVFSYYTDIEGKANSGSPSPYRVIDTDEYPQSTAIIATIGFRVYPEW